MLILKRAISSSLGLAWGLRGRAWLLEGLVVGNSAFFAIFRSTALVETGEIPEDGVFFLK